MSEDGLGTQVGENAIRLSGGRDKGLVLQEYYFTTKIYLFLMRQQTPWIKRLKKKFLTSVYSLNGAKTIIISTHNTDMLKNCDQIFEIKNKNLKRIK